MDDIITQTLGTQWAMFYTASMPVEKLNSLQTLDRSINLVNQYLYNNGSQLDQWNPGMQDEITRLLWVNWIYQRLDVEPIRKPILTHYQDNQFYVDCGDTRLMSLRLYNPQACVQVLTTCKLEQVGCFKSWTRVYNSQDLKQVAGFEQDAVVLATPGINWCFYWLEIGDQTTSHHLHSVDQRLAMMQHYIDQQTDNFLFSVDWAKSSVDWTKYQENN